MTCMDKHAFFLLDMIQHNPILVNRLPIKTSLHVKWQLVAILDHLGHDGNETCLSHLNYCYHGRSIIPHLLKTFHYTCSMLVQMTPILTPILLHKIVLMPVECTHASGGVYTHIHSSLPFFPLFSSQIFFSLLP